MFSGILGQSRSRKLICITLGISKNKKNVYEEGKKIVKTEAVFSLSLNQITKILYFAVVTIYKYANKLTVITKIYCISKLLAELGLSNSKSKTNSEATHSIEEIIPANISYCLNFNLNITELDESLPIIYYIRHP